MKTKLTILGIAAIAAGGLAGNHNQTEKPGKHRGPDRQRMGL